MSDCQKLSAGEWVEVRSKEEILATLDSKGQIEGLPFMPEMFACCGRRFRVQKRAHKTCDTISGMYEGRSMKDAVHLHDLRCNGKAHGGCEAGCLIFWKEAWLRKVSGPDTAPDVATGKTCSASNGNSTGCSEADVIRNARIAGQNESEEPVYVCQTTELLSATRRLSPWDTRQYFEDISSGNVGLGRMVNGFIYMGYKWLVETIRGRGARALRRLYDATAGLRGGYPYPRRRGTVATGVQTPTGRLNLQPGELVRVKSHQAILATLDDRNRNRGLLFDAEMVPFCGRTYRVLKCVTRIVDEKTGRMIPMKTPCVILEGVVCEARYSSCRLFCPRGLYSYWREIWLERVEEKNGRTLDFEAGTTTRQQRFSEPDQPGRLSEAEAVRHG
jgi:hypothetical protein